MPTFEVHGIAGGYQGPGRQDDHPAHGHGDRLPPPRAEHEAEEDRQARDGISSSRRTLTSRSAAEHALPGYQGKTTGPYADAIRGPMKFAFGKEPVFVREGGSIGAVLSMEQVLKAPIHFSTFRSRSIGYHAPNENYDWRRRGAAG